MNQLRLSIAIEGAAQNGPAGTVEPSQSYHQKQARSSEFRLIKFCGGAASIAMERRANTA